MCDNCVTIVLCVTIAWQLCDNCMCGNCSMCDNCETQPPASIGWVALSSVFVCSFGCPASVTPPLISTIWCFRPHKPYIFSVIHCWVEPSLLLSSLARLWQPITLVWNLQNSKTTTFLEWSGRQLSHGIPCLGHTSGKHWEKCGFRFASFHQK